MGVFLVLVSNEIRPILFEYVVRFDSFLKISPEGEGRKESKTNTDSDLRTNTGVQL